MPRQNSKTRAHLITHTHWDREWYLPVETYRFRLIELFERLQQIFAASPDYQSFFLDGQTVPLEDYLEVRPEQRKLIESWLASGKVVAGPFYVLLDEQLVSGESYLRNLQIGREMCRAFGIEPPCIGYLPDNFGHISQTPQILRGYGIDNAVMWRGSEVDENTPPLARWRGPDGSELLAVLLIGSYANLAGADPATAPESMQRSFAAVDDLKRRGAYPLLLMAGIDHSLPHPDAAGILKLLREHDSSLEVLHSTLEAYLAEARSKPATLLLRDELIHAPHLDATFSSRMRQKILHRQCENILTAGAGPLCTIAWLAGADFPAADLDRAWRKLVRAQAHDSITGCHSDDVALDMHSRLARTRQIGAGLQENATDYLLGQRWSYSDPQQATRLRVFNPLPQQRRHIVEAELFLDGTFGALVRNIRLHREGESWEAQIVAADRVSWPRRSDYMIPIPHLHTRYKIEFGPVSLPPLGWTEFTIEVIDEEKLGDNMMDALGIEARRVTATARSLAPAANVLENEHFRAEIGHDTSVRLTCKKSGRTWDQAHLIEAQQDAGNLYNFSPLLSEARYHPLPGTVVSHNSGRVTASVTINTSLHVPAGVTADMMPEKGVAECPLAVTFTIRRDDPLLYVRLTFENWARNLCLRTVFNTELEDAVNVVSVPFDILERPPLSRDEFTIANRKSGTGVTRYASHLFTSASTPEHGVTVLHRGLPEYTWHDDGRLTLTLLRGSEYIWGVQREQFPVNEYDSSGGHELGHHEREYALFVHAGDIREPDHIATAVGYQHPPLSRPTGEGPLPGFSLELAPADLIYSTLTRSLDGQGLILRFFNPRAAKVQAEITLSQKFATIERLQLDESPLTKVAQDTDRLSMEVAAKEIVTLKLCPRPE